MTKERTNPFRTAHFHRVDEGEDEAFYGMPRLVTHIDDQACASLTRYFERLLPRSGNILDLMSSCVSHLPTDATYRSVVGLGMNREELEANPQLTHRVIHNLNHEPVLPFEDCTFDACLITVSVQYLTQPIAVFTDVARVLRPGAPCAVSFSNRMFPSKAVAVWRSLGDADHSLLVGLYFEMTNLFDTIKSEDLSPAPGRSDPLYVVTAFNTADQAGAASAAPDVSDDGDAVENGVRRCQ